MRARILESVTFAHLRKISRDLCDNRACDILVYWLTSLPDLS